MIIIGITGYGQLFWESLFLGRLSINQLLLMPYKKAKHLTSVFLVLEVIVIVDAFLLFILIILCEQVNILQCLVYFFVKQHTYLCVPGLRKLDHVIGPYGGGFCILQRRNQLWTTQVFKEFLKPTFITSFHYRSS